MGRIAFNMFFEFGLKDIIDIVLVALMLYYVYRLIKESRSLNVFIGILVFVIMWLIVSPLSGGYSPLPLQSRSTPEGEQPGETLYEVQ